MPPNIEAATTALLAGFADWVEPDGMAHPVPTPVVIDAYVPLTPPVVPPVRLGLTSARIRTAPISDTGEDPPDTRFARYCDFPRDRYVAHVRGLFRSGVFSPVGICQVRIEKNGLGRLVTDSEPHSRFWHAPPASDLWGPISHFSPPCELPWRRICAPLLDPPLIRALDFLAIDLMHGSRLPAAAQPPDGGSDVSSQCADLDVGEVEATSREAAEIVGVRPGLERVPPPPRLPAGPRSFACSTPCHGSRRRHQGCAGCAPRTGVFGRPCVRSIGEHRHGKWVAPFRLYRGFTSCGG